jgi:alpha-tubulin suppressor-like RCC1 family protein
MPQVTEVALGERHACAITRGNIYCWGANDSGQLGIGNTTPASRPMPLMMSDYPGADRITAGDRHTCVVEDGLVNCWGDNSSGQLGDGTFERRLTRTEVQRVPLTPVGALSAGAQSTCVMTGRELYCWGANDHMQVGLASGASSATPVKVPRAPEADGSLWTNSMSVGGAHACAILGEGIGAWCWGSNRNGELGARMDITDSPMPLNAAAPPLRQVSAGKGHTCAVPADAGRDFAVYCWGANGDGQLGNGTTTDSATAVRVALPRAPLIVSAGSTHTCVLLEGGWIFCWGANEHGQLGNGTRERSTRPVEIAYIDYPVTTYLDVVAGNAATCAIELQRSLHCWGANDAGQLGNGEPGDALGPMKVKF